MLLRFVEDVDVKDSAWLPIAIELELATEVVVAPPLINTFDADVDVPNTIRPNVSTENRLLPVEEETANGVILPALPWTLKVTVDDVAFTPATVPLSIKSPVERVVADVNRATSPESPPVTPDIPRDDVATHVVADPVERST